VCVHRRNRSDSGGRLSRGFWRSAAQAGSIQARALHIVILLLARQGGEWWSLAYNPAGLAARTTKPAMTGWHARSEMMRVLEPKSAASTLEAVVTAACACSSLSSRGHIIARSGWRCSSGAPCRDAMRV
jgi:hypothetical protein